MNSVTWLPRAAVAEALNPHLQSILKIEPQHAVRFCAANELLSCDRLDVMAKVVYARLRMMSSRAEWGTRVYREHLRVWNEFLEGDGSGKRSFEDYRASFDRLLDGFSREGFDERCGLIPVGSNSVIIDGSHRLAAALACLCRVKVVDFELNATRYDYEYFHDRGLAAEILDDMALQYCRLDARVRVAVLFPVARGRDDEILRMLRERGAILCRKAVAVTPEGRENLIRLLYRNESWIGSGDKPTASLLHHVNNRFSGYEPVKFIFFTGRDDESNRELKDRIRALFSLGNDSLHINDTHEQTISIAESVLNANSIHFLNHARPGTTKNFTRLFRKMKDWLAEAHLERERFCIDGSSVLAAYGLRDAADLDYLYLGSPVPAGSPELVSCHNEEAHHYEAAIDDLVMDPRNYFYCTGMKFLAIHRIRDMKARRGEPKDIGDVYKIDAVGKAAGFSGRVLQAYYAIPGQLVSLRYRALNAMKHLIPAPLRPAARTMYRLPWRVRDSFGPKRRTSVYRGFELHYSKGTSLLEVIHRGRVYEPEVSKRLIQALKQSESPLFLDIGANIGLITLNVLAEVPNVRVVAFEPGPHQAQLLEETVAANGLGDRVTVVRQALSFEAGSLPFAVHRSRHASGDGFFDTHRAGRTSTIEVPVTTLDSWWNAAGRPRIDAMKMDTEGAELWVLKGGEATIQQCHPAVVFELHPRNLSVYPHKAADVLQFFIQRKYAVATLDGEPASEASLDQQLKSCNDYVAVYKPH